MNQRKQAIIAKFDQLSEASKEFVMVCMNAIIDKDVRPLQQLRTIHAGDSELCALLDEAVQHVQRRLSEVRA